MNSLLVGILFVLVNDVFCASIPVPDGLHNEKRELGAGDLDAKQTKLQERRKLEKEYLAHVRERRQEFGTAEEAEYSEIHKEKRAKHAVLVRKREESMRRNLENKPIVRRRRSRNGTLRLRVQDQYGQRVIRK